MSGVYNRKLFRQASARDELRRVGGIMASSEELLQEALRTAQQAPKPSDLGPMAPPPARPPGPGMMPPGMAPGMMPPGMAPGMMPPGMAPGMMPPGMAPGMMPPGMMPMAPMMPPGMAPGMMPMDPMMPSDPASFMPPQVPASVQPAAFAEGGPVQTMSTLQGMASAGRFGGGFMPPAAIDISQPAGTVVQQPSVSIPENVLEKAEDLASRVDDEDPETVGAEIVETAGAQGLPLSGDLQTDLASVYQSLTGDPAAYEKNIDNLNRGIIGAAIAAGTSARATQNIAQGMLVGLEAARDTEERRVKDARALQLAALQAAGKAGSGSAADEGARKFRSPVDAYQDAYSNVMRASDFDLELPEGVSREQYADQIARDLVRRSYTAEQLVGTPFEGQAAPAAAPAAASPEALLAEARAAIAAGAPEAAVRERLQSMGINPESL